jgi:hypothetical protein
MEPIDMSGIEINEVTLSNKLENTAMLATSIEDYTVRRTRYRYEPWHVYRNEGNRVLLRRFANKVVEMKRDGVWHLVEKEKLTSYQWDNVDIDTGNPSLGGTNDKTPSADLN